MLLPSSRPKGVDAVMYSDYKEGGHTAAGEKGDRSVSEPIDHMGRIQCN
jgi:hypothetical protein